MATTQTSKSNGKNGKGKHGKGKHAGNGKAPPLPAGASAPPKPYDPGKPTAPAKKQQSIPGTGSDVPDAVQEAADKARAASLALGAARKAYGKATGHLEMLMKQHKVELVGGIDDAGKEFEYELKPGEAKLKERTKGEAN